MAAAGEQAVREYLMALRDPGRSRDDARIPDLMQRLEATADPIQRLRLRAELARVQTSDIDVLEQHFVSHAKAWADATGVTAEAFAQEGVPRDVLRKAGLNGALRGRTGRRRRTGVLRQTVIEAVHARRRFTIAEVVADTGASLGLVRTIVRDMVVDGELDELGPAERRTGAGRAPKLYQRTSNRSR